MSPETPAVAPAADDEQPATPAKASRRTRMGRLTGADRLVVALFVVVPTFFVVVLVWVPALLSVVLSFTNWNGIGDIADIEFIGPKNYEDVTTIYPPFWPAVQNNVVWLVFLFVLPTVFGIFLAVLLDKEVRGSRFYQTALYIPVVLSLALIGFIWQLIYSPDQGLLNAALGTDVDWYGDPSVNLWAVLFANGWKHTGYIMLLYLAGLKGVDPALREAAAVDGSGEVSTFFRIILPVMRPINLIVVVVVFIESLRAFDLVWIINKGRNGLELIAALVTSNVIGEASRIGFGSAMSTIMLLLSSVFIAIYLRVVMKEDR